MKKTIWILGDQLSPLHTGLAGADRSRDVVLMVESRSRGAHLKYHKLKLVMIYAAMRHFAEELRKEGWTVDYHSLADTPDFESAWGRHIKKYHPQLVVMMEPNSWFETTMAGRITAALGLDLEVKPSCQFLVPRGDFRSWAFGKKRLLMENHYRALRAKRNILMTPDGKPEGGAWNFDSENRKTLADWKKARIPPPQKSLLESPRQDPLVLEVAEEVDRWFPGAFGSSSGAWAPVTRNQALWLLEKFVSQRLRDYGDYQDLMLENSPGMFHSLISAPINIGLLDPMECVAAAVNAWSTGKAPLSAVEGFVRQIIGWREFVNGVYWLKMPAYADSNGLRANRPLPDFFYTGKTGMNCLRSVLREVHATAYNHHIQRLMILGNFLLLAGIRPQDAYKWFLEMYVDAFDWVMAANVLGMALHADGGFMATKPYAGSGAYISRMSNYCQGCAYDPKKKSGEGACPFNLLYWDFFDRHAKHFSSNPRIGMIINSWRKRPEAEKQAIRQEASAFLRTIAPSHPSGEENRTPSKNPVASKCDG